MFATSVSSTVRIRVIPKPRYFFLVIALIAACCVTVSAQAVSFFQITDPHLFEGGQEEAENQAAFTASIKRINELSEGRADYEFVVVTGDIGIENLVSEIKDGDRIELTRRKRNVYSDRVPHSFRQFCRRRKYGSGSSYRVTIISSRRCPTLVLSRLHSQVTEQTSGLRSDRLVP